MISLFQKFLFGTHGRPLKRGKGLGNEKGGTCNDLYFTVDAFLFRYCLEKGCGNFIGEFADSPDILFCLCGKSQHEIKFYPGPSAFKGECRAIENYFFGQTLVDYIPKPLAACFRCKCEAALLHILYLAHHVQREGVDPKGRQGDVDMLPVTVFNQKIQQFIQTGIVAGT